LRIRNNLAWKKWELESIGEEVDTNEEIISLQKELFDGEQTIADNEIKIGELRKENAETPLKHLQNVSADKKYGAEDADKAIEKRQNEGRRVTEELYDNAIAGYQTYRNSLVDEQNQLLSDQADFLATWTGTDEQLLDNEDWNNYVEQLRSVGDAIDGVDEQIRGFKESKKALSLEDLTIQYDNLQRVADRFNRAFEDPLKKATGFDYVASMVVQAAQISNIQKQIADQRAKLAQAISEGYTAGDEYYDTLTSSINSLTNSLHNATDAQIQFAQSLIDLPVQHVDKQIKQYAEELEDLQQDQSSKLKRGIALTAKDYQDNIDNATKQARLHTVKGGLYNLADTMLDAFGVGEDTDWR